MACPLFPVLAPNVRDNPGWGKPPALSRFDRGSGCGGAHPALAATRSIAPNIRAPLARESDNSRSRPSELSGPRIAWLLAYFASTHPPPPNLALKSHLRSL